MPPRNRPAAQEGASTDLRNQVASPANTQAELLSAAKLKEPGRIRVSAWPKPAIFRHWTKNFVDKIVAASARPQRAFEWMLEMARPRVSYDDLREAGDDVATLDPKSSSALAHGAQRTSSESSMQLKWMR